MASEAGAGPVVEGFWGLGLIQGLEDSLFFLCRIFLGREMSP